MSVRIAVGVALPNRGVAQGRVTPDELLGLAEMAEQSGCIESVWVGDSLLAKPRLECVALLSAVAARTRAVGLGPACFASFPLRHPVELATQWASLDRIAAGRTVMVACLGGGGGAADGDFAQEYRAMGVKTHERVARLEEGITLVRRLWREERVTHRGHFWSLQDVAVSPRPVRPDGPPIWIANNPHALGRPAAVVDRAAARVARLAEGWMTAIVEPQEFRAARARIDAALTAEGRAPAALATALYHNICVRADRAAAFADAKAFLDDYYGADFSRERVETWTAHGDGAACAARLHAYVDAGVRRFVLRLAAFDHRTQLRRLIDDVIPRLERTFIVAGPGVPGALP